ncbi:MAG: hypothetical protein ABEI13_03235, partial [Candidatus Paceibacteria bacterium]
MESKSKRAMELLRRQGLGTLLDESFRWFFSNTKFASNLRYSISKYQIEKRMQREDDMSDILDTALEIKPGIPPYEVFAMQLRDELSDLIDILSSQDPQVVLELGTAKGGTLYTWSRCFNPTIISVDLPSGEFGGGYPKEKESIYELFTEDIELIRGNTHSTDTYMEVEGIVNDLPSKVDFLFIDG